LAQAVESRSNSRISGQTSEASVIDRSGRAALQDLGGAPLVVGVDVGVQVADGHALDAVLVQHAAKPPRPNLVQRDQHAAVAVEPLAHRQAQVARHQRPRPVDHDVVLLEAVLVGHFQRVAVPLGGQQRGARAACARSARWSPASCRG
jgi:hypothetical protein